MQIWLFFVHDLNELIICLYTTSYPSSMATVANSPVNLLQFSVNIGYFPIQFIQSFPRPNHWSFKPRLLCRKYVTNIFNKKRDNYRRSVLLVTNTVKHPQVIALYKLYSLYKNNQHSFDKTIATLLLFTNKLFVVINVI